MHASVAPAVLLNRKEKNSPGRGSGILIVGVPQRGERRDAPGSVRVVETQEEISPRVQRLLLKRMCPAPVQPRELHLRRHDEDVASVTVAMDEPVRQNRGAEQVRELKAHRLTVDAETL